MTIQTLSSAFRAAAPSLSTFLDLLACPVCKAPLHVAHSALQCTGCERRYRVLPESGVPVLLPDETLTYEPNRAARERKAHVRERFATIQRALPARYGPFATFLNLGYVPNGSPQYATRGPDRPALNPHSTRLLFEVLGACDLDGRTVLDLGTGRGGNVAMIQRYYAPRMVVGVDLSLENVEFCQRQHTIQRGGFLVGDVELLPIRSSSADVILNLESSHYYPNIERFFDEVHRALVSGGEFLYADILPSALFDAARHHLRRIGFEIARDQDISANVLLSCDAISAMRGSARHAGLYDNFTVVPGSEEYAALRNGETAYRILSLRKS